jgi:hypothetical protein
MRVVINKCFGGWGLSSLAMVWLVENHPESKYLHKSPLLDWGDDGKTPKLTGIEGTQWSTVDMFEQIITQDGETAWTEDFRWRYSDTDIDADANGGRYAPELLACIEALGHQAARDAGDEIEAALLPEDITAAGLKAASGRHAQLVIVEIPDDIEWEIDEYDGVESIHEKHRSWG